jgi:hypothetical protein
MPTTGAAMIVVTCSATFLLTLFFEFIASVFFIFVAIHNHLIFIITIVSLSDVASLFEAMNGKSYKMMFYRNNFTLQLKSYDYRLMQMKPI